MVPETPAPVIIIASNFSEKYIKRYLSERTNPFYLMVNKSPIVPESRRRPLHGAVALVLVMAAVLLAAGCEDVIHSHAQDLVIVKLNHDGSTAWIKTIDTGKNYRMNDVLQTSDGGYALGGISSIPLCNPQCNGYENSTPTIIRLSNNGEVVSELGFPSEIDGSGQYMILGLVQTPDSGFYAISDTGIILLISPRGTLRGSRVLDMDILNKTEDIRSFIRTHDGGSIITGFTYHCELNPEGIRQCLQDKQEASVEKLDQNGITSWSRSYADSGFLSVDQIIELNNDKGYVSVMNNNWNNSLVMLDKNGVIVNSSLISVGSYRYNLQSKTNGFSVIIHRNANNTFPVFSYDYNGIRTETKLINFTFDPDAIIATSDSGYLSVNKIPNNSVRKMYDNGEPIWDRPIASLISSSYYSHVWNLIETSDKGYLIILGIEKQGSLYK